MLPKLESQSAKTQSEARSASVQPKITSQPFAQKLTFICKFCGGKSCKHENWMTHPESAIKGLNSDWVTSDILATQRPSTRINNEYNIIQAFKDNDINAIFNLQEPGEHPFCGDGIHPQCGFSYFPEEFSDNGIYFFNFGWKDMTATSPDVIIKILKQMSFSLAEGHKIAIHCHAGRGRTGLIIAAWLIYNQNMSAKEAIKVIRSKRKGSIQSKSQEEVLFKLEKELRESRIIFHATPKYKLEDFLFHQKKILPLSYESEIRFVPNLVLLCLERMETLMNSGLCTARELALAFSSPNDTTFSKGEWSGAHEKHMKSMKEKINTGVFRISEIDDPRYLAQLLLDFFDCFASPAIRNQFIECVHAQVHQQDKLTRAMKDQFFSQVNKKEFLLVECFAKFFSRLIANDETIIEFLRRAVLRLSISLVLERKKWDKLFLKRSLIKDHHGDDKVSQLHVFILKWIENFSHHFTEMYMANASPLKISEKRVQEKIERGRAKHGTYLDRVLHKRTAGSERGSSPGESAGDLSPIKLPGHSQADQDPSDGERATSPDLPTDKFIPMMMGLNHERSSPGSDNLNSHAYSHDEIVHEPRSSIKLMPGEQESRIRSALDVAGDRSLSSFSPAKSRSRTVVPVQPNRLNLLEGHNLKDSVIKQNYDKFFSNNELFESTTPKRMFSHVSEEESEGSDMSDKDRFLELVEEIDKLNPKKKKFILERLSKVKEETS